MYFLVSIIIPIISFFFQAYPRFFNRYFGVDVWTRLIEIDHIRKAKHKIPGKITKGFIIEGYFDYPLLFPWIFSFFPKQFLLEIQGLISPFFDVLQNLLLFFITYQLTQSVPTALVAQLIYTLTPMIAVENSNLTPRSFGYLNFTLAFYPLFLFNINHQWIYLLIGFIFTCCLFLSHRFALQSFVFLSLFFTIIDWTPLYLLCILAGFLLVVWLTDGYYLRVLKGHMYNIYFWVKNYQYRFAHQVFGNQEMKKLDWVGKVYHILSVFSPVMIFGINMWIISAFIYFYLVIFQGFSIANNEIYMRMSLWIIFFYIFGIFILKIKRLIPIGEGQRYLEMATVPASILSAILFFAAYRQFGLPALIIFVLLLLINLVLILFIQTKGIIKDRNRSLTKELREVFKFINKLPGTPRILCIPQQFTTIVIYHTKADVFVNADNPGLMKVTDVYPILKKTVSELAKEHKLQYLLLREGFAKLKDLKLKSPKVIFRAGDIVMVKLQSGRGLKS
jgi:hypothetical protein